MGFLRKVFGKSDEPADHSATCDKCGAQVTFDGDEGGSVVITFGATARTTTLCASCQRDEEKERQWRETGIWVGDDLPPSLRNAQRISGDELRALLNEAAPDEGSPPAP